MATKGKRRSGTGMARTGRTPAGRAGASRAASVDLSALTSQFGFAVRMTQLYVFDQFHRELWRRHRLHPGAYSVLLAILTNPGIRPGNLADALVIKRPNMTKLLDALSRRGWIERRAQTFDGRGVSLTLTRSGEQRLSRIRREALLMDERMTAGLTRQERRTLLALLNKLLTQFHGPRGGRILKASEPGGSRHG